jgi:hypothetical protein
MGFYTESTEGTENTEKAQKKEGHNVLCPYVNAFDELTGVRRERLEVIS